jgi:transmembrane sensor
MCSVEKKDLPTQPKQVNTDYLLGWMNGVLVFEKTSLLEIVRELERFYDIKIEISSSELANKTLTASYDNTKIENVLSSVCIALNVQYKKESGKYKIF